MKRWKKTFGVKLLPLDRAVYRTHRWWQVKQIAKARAKYRCEKCGQAKPSLSCHHVVPLLKGGAPFSLDNIKVLCNKCHYEVHTNIKKPRDGEWKKYEEELYL